MAHIFKEMALELVYLWFTWLSKKALKYRLGLRLTVI